MKYLFILGLIIGLIGCVGAPKVEVSGAREMKETQENNDGKLLWYGWVRADFDENEKLKQFWAIEIKNGKVVHEFGKIQFTYAKDGIKHYSLPKDTVRHYERMIINAKGVPELVTKQGTVCGKPYQVAIHCICWPLGGYAKDFGSKYFFSPRREKCKYGLFALDYTSRCGGEGCDLVGRFMRLGQKEMLSILRQLQECGNIDEEVRNAPIFLGRNEEMNN